MPVDHDEHDGPGDGPSVEERNYLKKIEILFELLPTHLDHYTDVMGKSWMGVFFVED